MIELHYQYDKLPRLNSLFASQRVKEENIDLKVIEGEALVCLLHVILLVVDF